MKEREEEEWGNAEASETGEHIRDSLHFEQFMVYDWAQTEDVL